MNKIKQLLWTYGFPIIGVIIAVGLALYGGLIVHATDASLDIYNGYCEKAESSASGVIVHGYDIEGWIANINNYPVVVKQITTDCTVIWCCIVEPGEKIVIKAMADSKFIIYGNDLQKLAVIKPVLPEGINLNRILNGN